MQLPKIHFTKKHVKISLWILGVFSLLIITFGAVAYAQREALLDKMMAKVIAKAKEDYNLQVQIGEYSFKGLSTVQLNYITLVPDQRDTLSHIQNLTIGVKLFPLIFGNVKLSELELNEGHLDIVLRDSLTNLDFILKKKKTDTTENKGGADLSKLAERLLNQVLYKIPDDMKIKNFTLKLNDNDTASVKLQTTEATIDNGKLQSTILVNDTLATWHINGKLNPSDKQLNIQLFAEDKKVELPYLENRLHAKLSFDTIKTEMKNAGFSSGNYKISGSWAIKNLTFNHPRISSDDIIVPDAQIDADMLIGEHSVCLDSTSTVRLRDAIAHPYLKYTLKPNKIYEVKLNVPQQDAQVVFNCFPVGLFESLEGIKVQGKLKYDLDFYLDSTLPDSVRFSSMLKPTDFKILQFGKTDLQKINSSFVYTPYEYGKPMRNITIGPANPNFTRLEDISPNFKNALLTAEDPSFFHHKGFVEESIRKSIAVNFKEKRFKRGGSTISMQLVKNVFLSRKKTLVRKAEETLIVWLIENNRLASKARMLEVYFNIIEMGNNVYGIGEASHYYFGKSPSELSQGEGIFLANIVPKPKAALYKFMSDGSLKPYLMPYFKFIGGIMARRGLTTPDSTDYGFYDVRLKESMRQYLLPDSVKIDTNSVEIGEDDMMTPDRMQDKSKQLFDRLYGSSDSSKVRNNKDSNKVHKNIRRENIDAKKPE